MNPPAPIPDLVLASASPRRRELLTQAGYRFRVHPAHIPEDPIPNEDPIAYVTRLARQKAETVYRELARPSADPHPAPGLIQDTEKSLHGLSVLGSDTTVTLDNLILGKPSDPADAARILRLLSGRTHRVITGIALVSGSGTGSVSGAVSANRTEVAAEVTAVQFLTLSEAEIQAYIATGEPMDKAGAYGIQGHAARWIPRISGCYFNVVGLPIALVSTLLQANGIYPQ